MNSDNPYNRLENEQEPALTAVAVETTVLLVPPSYESGDGATNMTAKLPNYVDATTLPSYEEALCNKAPDDPGSSGLHNDDFTAGATSKCCWSLGKRRYPNVGRCYDSHCPINRAAHPVSGAVSEMAIGTDGSFVCTFLFSFLFNWLGFIFSLCFSNTVAGRCGALSGLGLSIIKWMFIVKHKQWATDYADGDSWLWWLLFACGFLLFIRGAAQYGQVKYDMFKSRFQRCSLPEDGGHAFQP